MHHSEAVEPMADLPLGSPVSVYFICARARSVENSGSVRWDSPSNLELDGRWLRVSGMELSTVSNVVMSEQGYIYEPRHHSASPGSVPGSQVTLPQSSRSLWMVLFFTQAPE